MEEDNVINLLGVNRVFTSVIVLRNQFKSIYPEKDEVLDFDLYHIRNELYKVYCCRIYDVMEAVLKYFKNYNETIKIRDLAYKEYGIDDEQKSVLNITDNTINLNTMLNSYRVMYTHPQVYNINNRINNKTLFEINIDEETIEELFIVLKECIDDLVNLAGKEKIFELSIEQDKMLIIKLNKMNKQINIITQPIMKIIKDFSERMKVITEPVIKSSNNFSKRMEDITEPLIKASNDINKRMRSIKETVEKDINKTNIKK